TDQGIPGAQRLLKSIRQQVDQFSNLKTSTEVASLADILYGNFTHLGMDNDPDYTRFLGKYLDSISFVDLPFPLHVSAIRNASRPAVNTMPLAALLENPKTVFSVLVPPSEGTDVIPSFSEQLDKAETELVMSNLLSTLSSEKIHYVGIAATDVQDTIYLARE